MTRQGRPGKRGQVWELRGTGPSPLSVVFQTWRVRRAAPGPSCLALRRSKMRSRFARRTPGFLVDPSSLSFLGSLARRKTQRDFARARKGKKKKATRRTRENTPDDLLRGFRRIFLRNPPRVSSDRNSRRSRAHLQGGFGGFSTKPPNGFARPKPLGGFGKNPPKQVSCVFWPARHRSGRRKNLSANFP